ncbi:uro-adherence factor A isoform X2 [Macrobrachium rosenbergii]|uniref:uro-adherence factor A isoform X2 n=1 Tax=Macrobrachium rosenbergii TaxID=79674 RepID=UPI0034D4F3D1
MAPKRDKSKKEKMREARRQGDPSFPAAASQHPTRIPRPSILLSGRQNIPQHQQGPHSLASAVSREPQDPTATSKTPPGKGLRVTFDLTKNVRDGPEIMSEDVAECWEDLSDDGGGHKSDDEEYVINDDDVIDCEKEFGDFGEEFTDFGAGGGPVRTSGSGQVDFLAGPRHAPGLNDLEDFGDIGGDDDDYGSDYDNVDKSKDTLKNYEQNVRYFSEDSVEIPVSSAETPVVCGVSNTVPNSNSGKEILVPEVEGALTTSDSNLKKTSGLGTIKTATQIKINKISSSTTNKIPYIDSTKADDDDEWETDLSGGSNESGKIYTIDNEYSQEKMNLQAQQINQVCEVPSLLNATYDDATLADQPSLAEEDDSDIITNEVLDAAFHSVMKGEDDCVPELVLGGNVNAKTMDSPVVENPSEVEGKLESKETLVENETKTELCTSEERESELSKPQSSFNESQDVELETEKHPITAEVLDNEKVQPDNKCVNNKGNNEENREVAPCIKVTTSKIPKIVKESFEKYKNKESNVKQESPPFIGPLEKPDQPEEPHVNNESVVAENKPGSPCVSVGFECHEAKIKNIHGSETESEGELVIGEDKCVGTADGSDNEPVDLSLSERTSSKGENDMSESRDSLSLKSEDESQSERGNFAPDTETQESCGNLKAENLEVSPQCRIGTSPSPEIIVEAPLGNSESSKEKEKIVEKKNGKKKGKKNKRDGKLEASKTELLHPERPRLVRGKSWKEKREKFKSQHGDALPLSFGKELCESELVEATSNLLTETYTEASLQTASKCSTETTIVTETPCTACSSVTVEFNESESLCKGCLCREKKRPADAMAQVTEMRPCSENMFQNPVVTELSNKTSYVVFENEQGVPDKQILPEQDDFYVVKSCEVAVPSEVHTEYVPDSESSEEANGKNGKSAVNSSGKDEGAVVGCSSNNPGDSSYNSGNEPELFVDSSNSSSDDQNPVYFDAKDSSCTDKVGGSYDYVENFPGVIGTQNINYIYSYDDAEYQRQTDRPKLTVKPLTSSLGTSCVVVVNMGKDNDDDSDTPLTSGEIIYEGPCMCGPSDKGRNVSRGNITEEQTCEEGTLYVPPLFGSDQDASTGYEGKTMGVEAHDFETNETMGSNPEDSATGAVDGDSKDIRSRIKEIVGPRLHQKRGRHTVRRHGGARSDASFNDSNGGTDENLDTDAGIRRDESPIPGSSPASSSGVQGSDEMSPSRSCSRSPSREDSASPPTTIDNMSDLAYETYQVQTASSIKTKDDVAKGSVESSPAKTDNQVDYSFKTFRDMYQINPSYMTDSDDHDDLNESDTITQGSPGLSYDPDRSITVSSIVQRWEVLQAQAVERQRQSSQIRELQRQVKNLRLTLENLAEQASDASHTESLETPKDLAHKLQDAKALFEDVKARKAEVSSLNLAVHRFFTDSGYSLAQLKDEVNDLYILYDEAHRRASNEVSRLEGLEATWKLWEAEAEELTRALRQDGDTLKVLDAAIQTGSLTDSVTASMQDVARLLNERCKSQQPGKKLVLQHTRTQGVDIQGSTLSLGTSGDDCLSDSGTSGYESCSSEELSERERRLAHLRRLARDLEASLSPDSQAWQAITKTLSSAEMELKGLQKHCRDLVVRSTETLDQTKTSPQLRRRSWVKDSKVSRMSRGDRRVNSRDSNRGYGRRGWVWRVVRAALPFQAALLLLFCVACLLEPNCCDTHNSLTMTLTPQLRYVHGPPPV